MDLESAYLERILLHLVSNDPDDTVLTTDMNSWHAHSRGAPFLKKSGRPRWLSNRDSKGILAADLHAVSKAAKEAHANGQVEDLVIDHTIPSAELIRGLRARQRKRPFAGVDELRAYLKRRFTLALITRTEHNDGLKVSKSTMATGWCDDAFEKNQSLRFSRYDETGIEYEVQIPHE